MKRKGFTLIELLTVIAIIAILAAILFPVFNAAKKNAKKSADISNMSSIYAALKLYREDQGGYPPLLLQVAEFDPVLNRDRPVNELRRAYLYHTRIKDINTFTSVLGNEAKDTETNAFWPNRDPRPLDPNDPGGCKSRQVLGNELQNDPCPQTVSVTLINTQAVAGPDVVRYEHLGINPTALNGDMAIAPARFYRWDTYDISPVKVRDTSGNVITIYELRYCLFWSLFGQTGGGPADNPRQLGYNDPRDDTVITWSTHFTDFDSNTPPLPKHTRSTLTLFLNGSVRVEDAKDVYERSWRF